MSVYLHVPSQVKFLNAQGVVSPPWLQFFTDLASLLNLGYPPPHIVNGVLVPNSSTIVTAKLTTGGTEGSQRFTNGILVTETPAT
jgi:hypothetical protein